MPFVRGRYYINRVLGEALEGAREAEAALAALQEEEKGSDLAESGNRKGNAREPIRRVEIETAQVVPAHSGRATRGYVARIHRQPPAVLDPAEGDEFAASRGSAGAVDRLTTEPQYVETHAFDNHHDLVSFLRDQLGRDQGE